MQLHSFEVWCDGELVAGDLGYSVGTAYTSMSGFTRVDSAGTIQCLATARLLQAHGYVVLWCIDRHQICVMCGALLSFRLAGMWHIRRQMTHTLLAMHGRSTSCCGIGMLGSCMSSFPRHRQVRVLGPWNGHGVQAEPGGKSHAAARLPRAIGWRVRHGTPAIHKRCSQRPGCD